MRETKRDFLRLLPAFPAVRFEVPDPLTQRLVEQTLRGDGAELVVELIQEILVRLALTHALRLVRLGFGDELLHRLLLRLTASIRILVHAVVAAFQGEIAAVAVVAAAEVQRAGHVPLEAAAEVLRVGVVAAATASGGVRGATLEGRLVDGNAAVGEGQRGVVVVATAGAGVGAVVVVAEGEGLLARSELAEARARETADGALLRGHALVALAETAVEEGVRLARGVVLAEEGALALGDAGRARLEHVALLALHLATQDVELELAGASLEGGRLLLGGVHLLVREAVFGLLARRGALLLRHGGRAGVCLPSNCARARRSGQRVGDPKRR